MSINEKELENIVNERMKIIGRNLRELRMKHGRSQEEMGESIGVTKDQWSKYERGINLPGMAKIELIKTIYNIDYNAICDDYSTYLKKKELLSEIEKLSERKDRRTFEIELLQEFKEYIIYKNRMDDINRQIDEYIDADTWSSIEEIQEFKLKLFDDKDISIIKIENQIEHIALVHLAYNFHEQKRKEDRVKLIMESLNLMFMIEEITLSSSEASIIESYVETVLSKLNSYN